MRSWRTRPTSASRTSSLRYVDEAGAVSAAGAWDAAIEASWRLGVDVGDTRTEVRVGLVAEEDRVAISDLGGGDLRSPVWLTGPVEVRRTSDVLVIDRSGEADRVARLAQAAVPVVLGVLPDWRPALVVEVPASARGLDGALDADPGRYEAVAAVTGAVDGSTGPHSPVHVFINPEVLASLSGVGAQVVMSHEATHVAAGAASSDLPLWLLEGFADYVALRDIDLPESAKAAQVTAEVRRDGLPEALPGPAEFDTASAHLGAAYESAWLACVVLAEAGGEGALADVYRAVDHGRSVDDALRVSVGFDEAELVRRWQERLSDLAA